MSAVKRASTHATLSQKVFVRTSKAGNATKVVREQYLRDDIPCSSQSCSFCRDNRYVADATGRRQEPVLSAKPNKTKKHGPHYLVVDTNIVLDGIDLLESDKGFYDVIVPQIVLEEVRNRSLPIYARLRALTKNDDKRFYVFHNEYCKDTAVARLKGESINDRNDRAIRKVCEFYTQHLGQHVDAAKQPQVLLLTNDVNNRQQAKRDGLIALGLKGYVSELADPGQLIDMIPQRALEQEDGVQETKSGKNEALYPEYYPMSRLLGGIKNGTLFQGNLAISPYNVLEGSVSTRAYPKPLLVLGRQSLNRAFSGDQVVVELLPKDKWKTPSTSVIESEDLAANESGEESGETVMSEQERKLLADDALRAHKTDPEAAERVQPTARIVGIIKRSWRYYVGHIAPGAIVDDASRAQRSVLVALMDKTLPRVRIRTRQAAALQGRRIVIAVDSWPADSRHPEGHFCRDLGAIESKQAETEALLLEHDVEYRPFTKAVLDCLPAEGPEWKVPQDLVKEAAERDPLVAKRRDLRHLNICSIDPPGCQDIDDALHARVLPNGNHEVGVHIADVTHFVKPETALDQEGASRGTSVYLVDKRIDMLPMLLGTNLCSINPYVERYAFSVIWEMTPEGKVVSTDFTKSIISSREAFSYAEAQARIDDPAKTDELTDGMRTLLKFSKQLKQARIDAGALNLASPEVKVHLDSETSDPGEVEVKELLETNSLVEEFMLLANTSVAKKIYDSFPQTAMLRRHGAPPATNFETLNDQLRTIKGMSISLESSKALADSLDKCVDPNEPFFNTLVRIVATRSMLAAEYFSSGSFAYPEFRHYGLASEIYTHFTSPIRRYADVVAHRQLAAAIGYEPLHQSHREKDHMEAICKNINVRHRNAQFAGRASIEYFVGQSLKNVTKEEDAIHEGYVIKVFNNGVVVLVPKYGLEALIHIDDLGDAETAVFSESEYKLDISGRSVRVFDKVKVKVESFKDKQEKRKVKMVLL